MLPTKFLDNCLLVQEEEQKIEFQDDHQGSHLGFGIRTILAIFDLQVTPMQVSSQLAFGFRRRSEKIDFGFLIRMILAMFDLQFTPMLPIKLQVK